MTHFCDVCGKKGSRPLTTDERALWPYVASWVKSACGTCRGMFRQSGEKAAA